MFCAVSAGGSSPYSSMHQESPHPYYPNRAQPIKVHIATPIPPRYLIRNHGSALSPALFASDKEMPVPFTHCHDGVASTCNNLQLLASANIGNPNYCSFNPCNAQYQPHYYSPGEISPTYQQNTYKKYNVHVLSCAQCIYVIFNFVFSEVFHYYCPNLMPSHMSGGYYQVGELCVCSTMRSVIK